MSDRCVSAPSGVLAELAHASSSRASAVGYRISFDKGVKAFIGSLCGLLLVSAPAFSGTRPGPPPSLCAFNDCAVSSPPASDQPSSSNGKVKWHPGHYMQLLRNNASTQPSNRYAEYDLISDSDGFAGVMVPWRWSQLEGDQPGDYAAGIAAVEQDIAYLKNLAKPKRFILKVIDVDFGRNGGDPANSAVFPAYVRKAGLTYQGTNSVQWCRWNATAMGHYIDMIEAYAAAFDDEPYFEGIILYKETAPAIGKTTPCGYSDAAYYKQTDRLVTAAGAAFKRSNVLLSHNFLVDPAASKQIVERMAAGRVGMSGPDVLPPDCTPYSSGTWGYQAFRGDNGGKDYRGVIPSIWSIENSEMGGDIGKCTPAQLGQFANDSLHASHIGWDRNTFAGDSSTQWGAIVSYVSDRKNALTHTTCPTIYTQGCDTQ